MAVGPAAAVDGVSGARAATRRALKHGAMDTDNRRTLLTSFRLYGWGYLAAHTLWLALWLTPGAAREWTVGSTAIALGLPSACLVGLLGARAVPMSGLRATLVVLAALVAAGLGLALVFVTPWFWAPVSLVAALVGWAAMGALAARRRAPRGDAVSMRRGLAVAAGVIVFVALLPWSLAYTDHLMLTEAAMTPSVVLAVLGARLAARALAWLDQIEQA